MSNLLLTKMHDAIWEGVHHRPFGGDAVSRYFGELEADLTYRHWVIKNALFSPSLHDRNSAICTIDSDDHALIPALRFAINCERNHELRSDMQDALTELLGGSDE